MFADASVDVVKNIVKELYRLNAAVDGGPRSVIASGHCQPMETFDFGRPNSALADPNYELFPQGPIIPVPPSAPPCRPVGAYGNN